VGPPQEPVQPHCLLCKRPGNGWYRLGYVDKRPRRLHEGQFERHHPGVLLSGTTGRIPRFLTGVNSARGNRSSLEGSSRPVPRPGIFALWRSRKLTHVRSLKLSHLGAGSFSPPFRLANLPRLPRKRLTKVHAHEPGSILVSSQVMAKDPKVPYQVAAFGCFKRGAAAKNSSRKPQAHLELR
jgi:hypothetical protein